MGGFLKTSRRNRKWFLVKFRPPLIIQLTIIRPGIIRTVIIRIAIIRGVAEWPVIRPTIRPVIWWVQRDWIKVG